MKHTDVLGRKIKKKKYNSSGPCPECGWDDVWVNGDGKMTCDECGYKDCSPTTSSDVSRHNEEIRREGIRTHIEEIENMLREIHG